MESHLDIVREDFKTSPFWDFIGLQMKELKKGYVELYLPYNPNFRNVRDSIHGGIYASVLDTTMGMAGRTLGSDEVMTIQMSIQFLKPVVEGGIYSEASVISESRSTALIEGRLFDEDKNLIAHSVGTFRVVKSS
ncbi:PaaI family thioesterase [Sporosarcina siberiensis]|uniref:Medium/long-chain acyl-CoA thioesterase YigI n=1 Tax=Sporosarcina siberiensis TaxID=1365606 RepID=A0ABW4SF76_9BACL